MYIDATYKEYLETFNAFGTLNESQKKIFNFLSKRDAFIGNYSDLTRALGMDTKKMVSNIRKAVLEMQSLGMVYVSYKAPDGSYTSKQPRLIFLVDGWDYYLRKNRGF